jgi:hypothetical protein
MFDGCLRFVAFGACERAVLSLGISWCTCPMFVGRHSSVDGIDVAAETMWTTRNAALQTLCGLVGHVGSREAVTIVAAVVDTYPYNVFTPADLSGVVHDATPGFEVWKPIPQVVANYCKCALTSGGVVEAVTTVSTSPFMRGQPVRAYQSSGTRHARAWRLRVYDALAGWGLRHPAVSVQQVIGPPRGGGGSRPTPAHLRLPLYALLLRNPGQFVDSRDLHRQLTGVVTADRARPSWFKQTVVALTVSKILISRPNDGERRAGALALAPPWVVPIGELLRSLATANGGDCDLSRSSGEPKSEVLGNPDAIAALLDKTQRWSSSIVGHDRGASDTRNAIYEIVRSRPTPTYPGDIVDALARVGRPITRSRVSAYLRALVRAGLVTAVAGPGKPGPATTGRSRDGYLVAPPPSVQPAAGDHAAPLVQVHRCTQTNPS